MFLIDDLYQGSTPNPVVTPAPAARGNSTNAGFNFLNQFLRDFDISYWAVQANQWLLAFTVFYSFWFFMDFIFWRVLFDEGAQENEEEGLASLGKLTRMWMAYFVYLAIWSIAIFNQGIIKSVFEYISILIWLIVLVGVDLPMIPVIGGIFGGGAEKAGNVLTQIWGMTFGIFGQIWAFILEAVGIEEPKKAEKK